MNVIWIVADSVRQDHVGAYGKRAMHTPALDSLAAKSIRFDRHYAGAFPTMPGRADHHTGRWTLSYMGWGPLPDEAVTLAQVLARKGFTTAAVVDTPFYVRGGMNYDQGFGAFFMNQGHLMSGTHWEEDLDPPPPRPGQPPLVGHATRMNSQHESWDLRAAWRYEEDHCSPRTFTMAMRWLERHYKEDFFLYVDTWDPHEPWDAPPYYTELYYPGYDGEIIYPIYGYWQKEPGFSEEKLKKSHATYCGSVSMVDTWIGHLLRTVENLGLMEKTVIIFTTDHGFYFGEHGGLFGKMFQADGGAMDWLAPDATWGPNPLYEENILLPLIIHVPGVPPGSYNGLTSAVDVMPTVLEVFGQDIPDFVEGISLLPKMGDLSAPGRDFTISSEPLTNPGDPVRYVDNVLRRKGPYSTITINAGDWALLYNPEPGLSSLYNLQSDPRQDRNVISARPEVAKELHQYLVKFMRDTNVAPDLQTPRLELKI